MEIKTWLAFFVASCLIGLSPGSGALLSVTHGIRYGVRGASASIAGLQFGLVGTTLIAGVGVGAVLVTSAAAFMVVKLLGASYLMYLGWQQWHQADSDSPNALGDAAPAALSAKRRFLTGLLTNPKSIIFMVAVLPQFISSDRPLLLQMAILMATTVGIDVLVMHGYAFAGSRMTKLLKSTKARRNQNRFFGSVLMAMGLGLLLVRRSAH